MGQKRNSEENWKERALKEEEEEEEEEERTKGRKTSKQARISSSVAAKAGYTYLLCSSSEVPYSLRSNNFKHVLLAMLI